MARNQPRLFDPGPKGPDRWKLHPDKWVQDPNVVYHATRQATLPREDRGEGEKGYGSSRGMHFGDKATAISRALESSPPRAFVHTARLNSPQFSGIMTDEDANYSTQAEDWVKGGGTVRYANKFEGGERRMAGDNISYRVLPERTKTWSEDVQADPSAHPALKHLASKGYNPTVNMGEALNHMERERNGVLQPQLFAADVTVGGRAVQHHVNEDDAFSAAEDLNAKMRSAGGFGRAGVKRNNQRPAFWSGESAERAPQRMSRPRPE